MRSWRFAFSSECKAGALLAECVCEKNVDAKKEPRTQIFFLKSPICFRPSALCPELYFIVVVGAHSPNSQTRNHWEEILSLTPQHCNFAVKTYLEADLLVLLA